MDLKLNLEWNSKFKFSEAKWFNVTAWHFLFDGYIKLW